MEMDSYNDDYKPQGTKYQKHFQLEHERKRHNRLHLLKEFLNSEKEQEDSCVKTECTNTSNDDNGHNDGTIALAFAGGSFRAASSCGGILRGLHQKTILDCNNNTVPAMDAVKYNSGISGGAIPAILYSYAQIPTEELLEIHRSPNPAHITLDDLKYMPSTSYGYTLIKKPNFLLRLLTNITNPVKIFFYLLNSIKPHSWWSGYIYKKVCQPMRIPRNKYFASNKEDMEEIIRSNPKFKAGDFLLPRADVKTMPLILWSVHGCRADFGRFSKNFESIKETAWQRFSAEQVLNSYSDNDDVTPNMTQIILETRDDYGSNLPIPYLGTPELVYSPYNGVVEFGKNRVVQFPSKKVKPFLWGTRTRFSIETMLSLSTNFLGSATVLGGNMNHIVTNVFSTIRRVKIDPMSEETLLVADGGTNDLMGILPALQQKVEKIVSVYNFNFSPPHANFQTTYGDIYKKAPCTCKTDPNFDADFREWIKHINPRFTCLFGYFGVHMINHSNLPNHVFNDPKLDHLKDLMIKFNSLFEAGEPLVATMEGLETIDNPFWGVKGGNKVDLTLIWFNLPRKFAEQVPKELGLGLDEDGCFTNEEMKMTHFPELLNSPQDSTGYTPEQINMMAYLGSWIVHQAWEGLDGHDGKVKFEGFRSIFEGSHFPEDKK